ncbi:MAG: SGNH/GDSL hydrolase family protein [Oscillospiraceae bacterium]|nr:SGNH/GDSL hydrolase family protein [Oscillospiraceae bacterium]
MKRFLSVILAASLVLSLTGCGENTSSTSSDNGSSVSSDNNSVADNSSQTDSTPAADESSQPEESKPVEEIPYELGGDLTPTMIANSVLNKGDQTRLAKVIKKLQAGEEVTIAYLGGSITQGSSAGNELCYARLTTDWFEQNFPSAKINYVNAGIGATGSYIGVHRCDSQVLAHDPDLVFIDFSVNDTADRISTNKSTYESLLRKIWKHDSTPAIVTIAMTQEDGTSVQDAHYEIAAKYNIPMISYRNAILDVIDKGYIIWDDISDDNIHPNIPGHAVLTKMITNYIQTVADNVDSIDTSADPELPATGEDGMKFENAQIVLSDSDICKSTGLFEVKANYNFGGFNEPWIAKVKAGSTIDPEKDALVFEVEAQNIGILFGKTTSASGLLDVYVDDKLVKTINTDFSGGWGNYAEFAEISSFMFAEKHTIKILPRESENAAGYYVSAIMIS